MTEFSQEEINDVVDSLHEVRDELIEIKRALFDLVDLLRKAIESKE